MCLRKLIEVADLFGLKYIACYDKEVEESLQSCEVIERSSVSRGVRRLTVVYSQNNLQTCM